MKSKNLGTLTSFSIQGKLLIAMNEGWIKFLGDTPTFEAIIDKNGRYTVVGPVVYQNSHSDPTLVKEDAIDE